MAEEEHSRTIKILRKKYMLFTIGVFVSVSILVVITNSIGFFLVFPILLGFIIAGYIIDAARHGVELREKMEDELYSKVEDERALD